MPCNEFLKTVAARHVASGKSASTQASANMPKRRGSMGGDGSAKVVSPISVCGQPEGRWQNGLRDVAIQRLGLADGCRSEPVVVP